MGDFSYPPLEELTIKFIQKQHIFFIATAPLNGSNRVNVSPKSAKEFRVIDGDTVGYVDYMGSGNETAAHIYENGRVTMMFTAFTGAPKILRIYGVGKIVLIQNLEMDLISAFDAKDSNNFKEVYHGARCIVLLKVNMMQSSCGFAVPKYDFIKDRKTLEEAIDKLQQPHVEMIKGWNTFSIDG